MLVFTVNTTDDTSDVNNSTCLNPLAPDLSTVWTPAAYALKYERQITAVSGNTITGNLVCRGNADPVSNSGIPNSVTGRSAGQCSGL